tara:strand:- start:2595 stop:2774 length:180 start_codon:yes stop_codon:yes gene_type:complete
MEQQPSEEKVALETLAQAAGMARLSRDEHAAVQSAYMKVLALINENEKEVTPTEVVTDS